MGFFPRGDPLRAPDDLRRGLDEVLLGLSLLLLGLDELLLGLAVLLLGPDVLLLGLTVLLLGPAELLPRPAVLLLGPDVHLLGLSEFLLGLDEHGHPVSTHVQWHPPHAQRLPLARLWVMQSIWQLSGELPPFLLQDATWSASISSNL